MRTDVWPARDFDLNEIHDGSFVRITWSGGNGTFIYRVVARGVPGSCRYEAWNLRAHPGPSVFVGPIGHDDDGPSPTVREIEVVPRCFECYGPADFNDADRVQCECGKVVCSKCCASHGGESFCKACAWLSVSKKVSIDLDSEIARDELIDLPLPHAHVSPRGKVDFNVGGQWWVLSPDQALDLAKQIVVTAFAAKREEARRQEEG